MKKIILSLMLISVLLLAGCAKEIDTGRENCKEIMGSFLGGIASDLADENCQSSCQAEGYSYKQWKCSEADTIVCVCE